MSGLEVVGVILAGPPLIVSCLEHYRQVFEYMGTWRKFRAEYSQCKTQVETLVVRLDMTLDRLFLPSAKSKTDFERLKKAPSDNAWIEVEAKLRERLLPNVRSLYVSNMKDLQDAIQELRHVLAFDNKRFQEGFNQVSMLCLTTCSCHQLTTLLSAKAINQSHKVFSKKLRQEHCTDMNNTDSASERLPEQKRLKRWISNSTG